MNLINGGRTMNIGTYNLHQYCELNRLNTLCIIAEKSVNLI